MFNDVTNNCSGSESGEKSASVLAITSPTAARQCRDSSVSQCVKVLRRFALSALPRRAFVFRASKPPKENMIAFPFEVTLPPDHDELSTTDLSTALSHPRRKTRFVPPVADGAIIINQPAVRPSARRLIGWPFPTWLGKTWPSLKVLGQPDLAIGPQCRNCVFGKHDEPFEV
jgi:hypothetical protein